MDRIRAQEPGFAVRYLEKMMNATAAEQQAAIDRFGNEPMPGILSVNGSVAKINISGPLSPLGPSPLARFFGYGGTGYADIISAVKEVRENTDVTDVIIPMNTPGGLVTMLDEARQELAALAREKKVTFENHGMIASAGYWLASVPGARIVATSPTVETGSIGVKIVGYDSTEALKEYGYKKVTILSRNAPNKAAGVDTKEGIAENQRQADAMERIFISRSAEGRGVSEQTIVDKFGKGGLLVAQDPDPKALDALKVGMIDALVEGTDVQQQVADVIDNDEAPEANSQQLQDDGKSLRKEGGHGSASITPTETKLMNLKELLAANPGAQAEHDALISAAQNTGEDTGRKAVEARVTAAEPFLQADSPYPKAITALAAKVVTGKSEASALEAAVAVFDGMQEGKKGDAAAAESDEQGDTNAQEHASASASGVAENNTDFQAQLAAARKAEGLED